MKYRLKVYYWNPNGTNDVEIVDCKAMKVVDTITEAFFGIKIKGEFEFIHPKHALEKIAVSPVSDGSEIIEAMTKYFPKEMNMQEFQYRDFKIFGKPGYYRYESLSGGSVTVQHWKTLRGVKAAIDKEYIQELSVHEGGVK